MCLFLYIIYILFSFFSLKINYSHNFVNRLYSILVDLIIIFNKLFIILKNKKVNLEIIFFVKLLLFFVFRE